MDALKEAQLALPTDRVELRPGRVLAVHHRPSSSGSRDVAIFVHGSCASMVQWREQIENMAATGVSVVAYDFYGCGRSAKPQEWSCYAMDELYQDLVEVARRYGAVEALGGRNLVVAHSLGCSLALRMAAEWGTNGVNVSALALLGAMDAVPEAATGPLFRLPLCLLNWLQPLLSAGFETRALHEQTRLALTPEHQQLLRLCAATNGANPMYMCKAYYRQIEVPTAHQLALVRAPVLLLCGEADLLVPAECSRRLQEMLPGAPELQVIPNSSHQLMQEQPAAVNRKLQSFFSSVSDD